MKKAVLAVFIILSLINLFAVGTGWQVGIYFSKPLLMTTLALWFYLNIKTHFSLFAKYILAGIIFSIAGDTFLMFANKNPSFFLAGLGSFLITHLLYIAAFVKYKGFKNGLFFEKTWVALPIFFYFISFIYYLWPSLPSDFITPVLFYSIAISTMLVACINMKKRTTNKIANGLIIGASLFVISDSVIAVNKFKSPTSFPPEYIGLLIMATYILGQYLIAKNSAKANSPT